MILFWKCVMIAIMLVFFPAAAIASVKGFGDLIKMFQDLAADDASPTEEDSEP